MTSRAVDTPSPEREPDTEAGAYLEDDPETWAALVDTVRRYGPHYASLVVSIGDDDAPQILAGSIASYLADQHGVRLTRDFS